jgi:DNA-directed RNA polymerase specialized sigma24 family protein
MPTLDHSQKQAVDLYRLAYLLTGQRGASIDVTLEALESEGAPDSFFANWIQAWSRRVVIAKALGRIRGELAASAQSIVSRRSDPAELPPRKWALEHEATPVQFERALLAIDAFPRCAALLTVFEGMSLEDASILLDATRDLVRKAQAIGLRHLTRNLARMQGWTSAATEPFVIASEVQHA